MAEITYLHQQKKIIFSNVLSKLVSISYPYKSLGYITRWLRAYGFLYYDDVIVSDKAIKLGTMDEF